MRICFLTTVYPAHNRNGGDINSQRYADALRAAGAEVDVVGYLRRGDPWPAGKNEHIVEERLIETRQSGLHALRWMLDSLLHGLPYSAGKYRSGKYIDLIQRLHAERRYDLFVTDHTSRLQWLIAHLPPGLRFISVSHNIEHQLYQGQRDVETRAWMRWVYGREARLVKAAEDALARSAREIWTVTAEDAAYYAGVPGGCRARAFDTPPRPIEFPAQMPATAFDIGLLGNWEWSANAVGLRWFVDQVLPLLPPGLRIEVAGRGGEWLASRSPQLTYRGYVKDATEFLLSGRAVAVPSISGAGVQIKSLDAIALGLPVVANPFALRGIGSLPQSVRVAQTAAEFAAQLLAAVQPQPPGQREDALRWAEQLRRKFYSDVAQALREVMA